MMGKRRHCHGISENDGHHFETNHPQMGDLSTQRTKTNFFAPLKNIAPYFPGSFVEGKVGLGQVLKNEAHFSLWLNDTLPLFSRHTTIEMF